jgi:hypothetical protein
LILSGRSRTRKWAGGCVPSAGPHGLYIQDLEIGSVDLDDLRQLRDDLTARLDDPRVPAALNTPCVPEAA